MFRKVQPHKALISSVVWVHLNIASINSRFIACERQQITKRSSFLKAFKAPKKSHRSQQMSHILRWRFFCCCLEDKKKLTAKKLYGSKIVYFFTLAIPWRTIKLIWNVRRWASSFLTEMEKFSRHCTRQEKGSFSIETGRFAIFHSSTASLNLFSFFLL